MIDRRGQSALFDATAFLVIMMVASSSLYAYSGMLARETRASNAADEIAYARTMLGALMRTTLANASYTLQGEVVIVPGAPVGTVLVEELAVLMASNSPNFENCNADISEIAGLLADGREWRLECVYENATLGSASFSIGSELGIQRFSASSEPQMADGYAGRARITLHTWRP
ncbi:MAG: hypothetical protein V1934_07410 [Methanobacteriota archaeon]